MDEDPEEKNFLLTWLLYNERKGSKAPLQGDALWDMTPILNSFVMIPIS